MARRTRLVSSLSSALRVLLVALGVAPFIPGWFAAGGVSNAPLRWLDAWFQFQCSRAQSRTLFDAAVCARCLGLYVGLGLGALLLWPRPRANVVRLWVALASCAMLADVFSEALSLRPPAPWLRLFTGLALGYPVGTALVLALRQRTQRGAPSAERAPD